MMHDACYFRSHAHGRQGSYNVKFVHRSTFPIKAWPLTIIDRIASECFLLHIYIPTAASASMTSWERAPPPPKKMCLKYFCSLHYQYIDIAYVIRLQKSIAYMLSSRSWCCEEGFGRNALVGGLFIAQQASSAWNMLNRQQFAWQYSPKGAQCLTSDSWRDLGVLNNVGR